MSGVPVFSYIVISKNEKHTLPGMFPSLEEFKKRGGDMVLVDTGSSDGTQTISMDFGFRVIECYDRFKYVVDSETADNINKMFVVEGEEPIIKSGDVFFKHDEARNFAAYSAKNDFVVSSDCDEIFTTFDIDGIEKKFKEGVTRFTYDFVFSHNPDGTPILAFRTDTRIFDRRHWHWKGTIHEMLYGEGRIEYVGPEIVKLEHYQKQSDNRGKYLAGLALSVYWEPENDRNLHYFGRELMYYKRYKSALKVLENHFGKSEWDAEKQQSLIFMGNCYEGLGNDQEALRYWHLAFDFRGQRREPLMQCAEYWRKKEDKPRTSAYAAGALQVPDDGFYGNLVMNYTYRPHELLYWARGWMGDIDGARYHLNKCLEYKPGNDTYLDHMKYYFSEKEVDDAYEKSGKTREGKVIGKVDKVVATYDDKPEVSVLMPAHNAEKYIRKAIESCLNQTTKDLELIVVDDGSTDKTLEIAEEYAGKDNRVKVYKNHGNYGYPVSFSTGVNFARGKYIARLDADDWDDPTRLERSVGRLNSFPICDCVSCSCFYGEEGQMTQISTETEGMIPEKYMDFGWYGKGGAPVNATIVARREIYDMIGGFKNDSQYGMDSDWDVRANLIGARWAYINEPLYYYRRHPEQTVIKRDARWYANQQKGFLDAAGREWNNQFNPRRHMEIMVTGRCNQKCQYCSQATFNENHQNYDISPLVIDHICQRAKKNGARYEWVQFSGGEPLLWKYLEQSCKIIKNSGAFHKIRLVSNCCDPEKMAKFLDDGLIDMVYSDVYNANPEGVKLLREKYYDRATLDNIPHKKLPTEPIEGTLPARCNCDRPSIIGKTVYPCGNFYEHINRMGKNIGDHKDYFCSIEDDWIEFYRKVDRFNMDICQYCLANGKVWEKVEFPSV